jgi:hypothetical protein
MSTPTLPTVIVNAITNEYALPPGVENTPEFKKQLLATPLIMQSMQKNGESFELCLSQEKISVDGEENDGRYTWHFKGVIDGDIVRWPVDGSTKSYTTIWSDYKECLWCMNAATRENAKYDMLLALIKQWRAMRECALCRKLRRPLPGQTHCMECVLHPLANPPTGGSSAKRARTSSD